MKLSDYLAKYFEQKNVKHIFGVTGGGAMHLNDSFGKSKKIKFVMHHHEQAATMAAEAYSRLKKTTGVVTWTPSSLEEAGRLSAGPTTST